MISIIPEFKSGLVDVAFPNSKVTVQEALEFRYNEYMILPENKPSLYHWVLVLISDLNTNEFARLTELNYRFASYLRFRIYTIIPARDQKSLAKRVKWVGRYYRNYGTDNLFNLRWTSSKIRANDFGEIVSLTSPILLFGRYRNYDILYVWSSGFLSSLTDGCLEVRLSFHCFSLGVEYNDLPSI